MASGKYVSHATITYLMNKITSTFAKKAEVPKVDNALSSTSTNAIQNKAVMAKLTEIENKQKNAIYFK